MFKLIQNPVMYLLKENVFFRFICFLFILFATYYLAKYFFYIIEVVFFPFDWGPSDGDHLNFSHRIMQGLPIYPDLDSGEVLSIYNPLYYLIVGLFGGVDAGMVLARWVSLVSWLMCPFIIAIYYPKSWGWMYSGFAALFILLPIEPYMLLDIVNVTPDATMAFFFVCAMVLADRVFRKLEVFRWELLLVGAVSALCFLVKQQGIIAIIVVLTFGIMSRKDARNLLMIAAGFFGPLIVAVAYFEIVNSGQFLQDTLFGLDKVMVVTPGLAEERLIDFLIHNLAFTLCVVVGLTLVLTRSIKLSIWHLSFIFHLLLLLKILGNAGGGPNYFITFWITMVVISVSTIVHLSHNETPFSLFYNFSKIKWKAPILISRVLLIGLFINVTIGSASMRQQLNSIKPPSENLEVIMQKYYEAVGLLTASNPDAYVLTNRNVGALVAHNINVSNEGSTMFQYAWAHPELFNQNNILEAISEKKYDFIFTGIQPYPPNVRARIAESYKVEMTMEQGLMSGNIGLVKVYTPK